MPIGNILLQDDQKSSANTVKIWDTSDEIVQNYQSIRIVLINLWSLFGYHLKDKIRNHSHCRMIMYLLVILYQHFLLNVPNKYTQWAKIRKNVQFREAAVYLNAKINI